MNDDLLSANLGISRRDLLRRGAVVGGTLMWAAPVIQSLGRPAFAAEVSPTPDDGDGHAISYIAVVIRCADGRAFRAKFNADGTDAGWEAKPGPPKDVGGTCYPPGYHDATPIHGGRAGLTITIDPADPSKATLTVPGTLRNTTCSVSEVLASAFGGQTCQQVGPVSCGGGCTLHFDL